MMNKTTFGLILAIALSFLNAQAFAASLTSTVDRTNIGSGETLQLSVRYDQQTTDDPDFSPLEHQFEIISRSRQNKLSIVNGQRTSYTEWLLQLLPKKSGKLLIPSLRLKGEVSNAIEVTVAKQSVTGSTGTANTPVFIETDVDQNEVYVQAQLLLTLRINHSVQLEGVSSEELIIDDANIVKVGESEFYKTINGVRHRVIELKFAIFPETSGTLTIPSLRFDVTLPDRNNPFSRSIFGRGGKLIVIRTDQKNITVKPRPKNSGNDEWLPSQGISISEKWSRPLNELSVGEPVTRTLHITAQGLSGAQLPPLAEPKGDGFKIYPDQPQMNDDVGSQGIIGTRTESMAIVPTKEGKITLPAIRLQWWDTVNNKLQTTVLESRTLDVKPNTELSQNTPAVIPPTTENAGMESTSDEQPHNRIWLWLSLGLNAALTVALIALWLRPGRYQQFPAELKKETPAAPSEKALFKALRNSAMQGKADLFRESVLKWARQHWQNSNLTTLQQFLTQADNAELTADFARLDEHLYRGGNEEIDLLAIVEKLEKLRQSSAKTKPANNHKNLKPLYENS